MWSNRANSQALKVSVKCVCQMCMSNFQKLKPVLRSYIVELLYIQMLIRLDITARGLWSTFERTLADVRIFNPNSYIISSVSFNLIPDEKTFEG